MFLFCYHKLVNKDLYIKTIMSYCDSDDKQIRIFEIETKIDAGMKTFGLKTYRGRNFVLEMKPRPTNYGFQTEPLEPPSLEVAPDTF